MGFVIGAGLGGMLIAFGAAGDLGVMLFLGSVAAAAGSVMVAVGTGCDLVAPWSG
jgi:hypothetical protein